MSILAGPHDKTGASKRTDGEVDLLVFGYSCKLFRDDAKAILEDSGQLLIPWMGDNSLMVDRYDVRNKLEDKRLFGLKPNLSRHMSAKDKELEEELDRERYLALEWDEIRVAEQEEEEKKRKHESGFSAVGFTYNDTSSAPAPACINSNLSLPEHPSTSSVDCPGENEEQFIPPPGLHIPEGIQKPSTIKLHSIIEKTASFVSKQGTQMEIILKAKQKFNPFFSFLNYKDVLFPYYSFLKEVIATGSYQPRLQPDPSKDSGANRGGGGGGSEQGISRDSSEKNLAASSAADPEGSKTGGERAESDSDDSDSDDEGGYLHPLLMKASLKSSKPSTPEPAPPASSDVSNPPTTTVPTANLSNKKMSFDELLNLRSSSFEARSKAINSAPPLGPRATQGQATPSYGTYGEAEALASYEHYRQQYYASSSGPRQDAGLGYQPDAPPLFHDARAQQAANGASQDYPYTTPNLTSSDQYPAHFTQPVPPLELRAVVDKTAEYVAKNSEGFERTVLERHIGDARFSFLNPWDRYHAYYQLMKQHCRAHLQQWEEAAALQQGQGPLPQEAAAAAVERANVQRLSSSGAISFKLSGKSGGPSSLVLPPPCSEFGAEEGAEDTGSGAARGETEEVWAQTQGPPAKRLRVENGGGTRVDGEDEIGRSVQAFLQTVKDADTPTDAEDMGSTVQVFLSTVKGLFGREST